MTTLEVDRKTCIARARLIDVMITRDLRHCVKRAHVRCRGLGFDVSPDLGILD